MSPLYGHSGHLSPPIGYAIQIAAEVSTIPGLIPRLKALGATDIIITGIRQIVA